MPRLNPFASGRTSLTKKGESRIDGHVVELAWSDSLDLIAAASADGPISIFDAKSGQVRHALSGHGFGTSCVAWSVDGKHLASAGQDGKIRLWDPVTGNVAHELPAGAAWAERVAWCPTANVLASAAGKKLRLWNLAGEMVREFPDHPSTITDIRWKPGEPILASAAYAKLSLWNTSIPPSPPGRGAGGEGDAMIGDPALIREFTWQSSLLVLEWHPKARFMAAGAQDCTVHFWEMASGEDLQMSGYPTKVRELSWDASGRWLATGGGPTPTVWDFTGKGPSNSTPLQFDAHQDNVNCLAFQRRGSYLASGGEDGLLALWQPGRQKGALALAKHDAPITQLAWAGDDCRLAVGTADGAVVLYAL